LTETFGRNSTITRDSEKKLHASEVNVQHFSNIFKGKLFVIKSGTTTVFSLSEPCWPALHQNILSVSFGLHIQGSARRENVAFPLVWLIVSFGSRRCYKK